MNATIDREKLVGAVEDAFADLRKKPKDGNSLVNCRSKTFSKIILDQTNHPVDLSNFPEWLQQEMFLCLGYRASQETLRRHFFLLDEQAAHVVQIDPDPDNRLFGPWSVTDCKLLVPAELDDRTLLLIAKNIPGIFSAYSDVRKSEALASAASGQKLSDKILEAITYR